MHRYIHKYLYYLTLQLLQLTTSLLTLDTYRAVVEHNFAIISDFLTQLQNYLATFRNYLVLWNIVQHRYCALELVLELRLHNNNPHPSLHMNIYDLQIKEINDTISIVSVVLQTLFSFSTNIVERHPDVSKKIPLKFKTA